jgi:hypothetical protein
VDPCRLVVAAIGAVCAPLALAGQADGDRQSLEFTATSERPNSSTGTRIVIDYVNPADPRAKPFAVDRVELRGHPGTRIDTSVPARCGASDAQLVAQGASACPRGSIVGGGVVRTDSGGTGPLRFFVNDVTLINGRDQLIFLLEERRSGFRLVTRAPVTPTGTITRVPFVPGGPPDGQLAIDFVDLRTRAISNARGNYITTPPTCPASGRWTNRGIFSYDDDQDGNFDTVQTERSATPCRPSSPGGANGEITGTSADDRLVGTPGDDVIRCGAGDDRVDARGGDDTVLCGSGHDVVRGGSGNDRLFGRSGHDRLFGEAGDDRLVGGSGDDRLDGGPGRDSSSP